MLNHVLAAFPRTSADHLTSSPDVEVLDVDVLVGRRLPLAPQQEALLGRRLCGGRERGGRGEGGAITAPGEGVQALETKLSASF